MKQTICDKCGKRIELDKYQYMGKDILSLYKIIKMEHDTLDLCHECAMELDSWLKNEGRVNE